MKLIVGLGNPGPEYANHRHNIGFKTVAGLGRAAGIKYDRKKCLARIGTGDVSGSPVVLARPQTYMNNSGESVARLCHTYSITPEDVVVIHDELDLPPGVIRLKAGGGSGGHLGVESVAKHLDDPGFTRVRIGIGRPEGTGVNPLLKLFSKDRGVVRYVLSEFAPEEQEEMSLAVRRAVAATQCLLGEGLEKAMNLFN